MRYLEKMREANGAAREIRDMLRASGDTSQETKVHIQRMNDIIARTGVEIPMALMAESGLPMIDGEGDPVVWRDPDYADTQPWSGDVNELARFMEATQPDLQNDGLTLLREAGLPIATDDADDDDRRRQQPLEEDSVDATDLDDHDDDDLESASSVNSGEKQKKPKETARGASDPSRRNETEDEEDAESLSNTGGASAWPSREAWSPWRPIREVDARQALADAGVLVTEGVQLPERSEHADDWQVHVMAESTAQDHQRSLAALVGLPMLKD